MIIEDKHFEYLRVQKGSLDHMSHDPQAWKEAYEYSLEKDYASLEPWLPNQLRSVLDIGGGLGGIDIVLNRIHGPLADVCILDGENDKPVMVLHRQTFGDRETTLDFLRKNGVERAAYLNPTQTQYMGRTFDLILSLGSWCFHYSPSVYLNFARESSHTRTRLIVDVRNDKREYIELLKTKFDNVGIAMESKKFDRLVFDVRGVLR